MRNREREAQKKGKPVEECITELTTTRKTDVFLHRTFEGDSEMSIMGYKGSAFISPLVKCGRMSINSPIILGLHMEVLSEFPTGVLQPPLFRKQEVHIAGRGEALSQFVCIANLASINCITSAGGRGGAQRIESGA